MKDKVFLLFWILISNYGYGQLLPDNRRINWEPGVTGGIPEYPVFANVKDAPYNATGDGTTDDAAAIQAAIDACPDGQAVYIPPGEYYLGTPLGIFQKSVVIRGAGPENTRLTGVIEIYSWGASDTANILSGFEKNSRDITIDDATNFNVGDYVIVDQENDSSFVTKTGYISSGCSWCSRDNGNRAMGQIVEITGKTGNNLELGRPLYFTFHPDFSPQIKKVSYQPVVLAGIEDLYLDGSNYKSTISIRLAVNCWVKNVESYNPRNNHVHLLSTYGCTIRDSYFHHGQAYTSGSAYGVFGLKQCTDNLIENNIFYYLRHSMVLEGGGCGNVFGYNYSSRVFDDNYPDTDWLGGDLITHGAHPYMNLFEGNIVAKISLDNTWGSSSHNTFFRNQAERKSEGENESVIYSLVAVSLAENNRFQNFIGNVLGTEGCKGVVEAIPYTSNTLQVIWKIGFHTSSAIGMPSDTLVKETLFRHGNYDYISQITTWNDTISDHELPNSLYLDEKPEFFGTMNWPVIGPDVTDYVDILPARQRFEELMDTISTKVHSYGTNTFAVFPNPATKDITIQIPVDEPEQHTANLYTFTGTLLKTIEIKSPETQIDLQQYRPGVYFIQVKNKDKNYVYKLIKQ